MALISNEMIEEARKIDLKNFLENEEGFTFFKESNQYYRCKEHNSLVLKYKNRILMYY